MDNQYARLPTCIDTAHQLRSHLNSLTPSPFPINALFDELLLQVLLYACGESADVYRPAGGVWHLRHVCSRWRELIHSTPTFWNKFSAMQNPRLPDTHEYYPNVLAKQIKACLEFSRTAPLSISISITAYLSADDIVRRTIKGIMDHSLRLVFLHINGIVLERLLEDMKRPLELPNLRAISISGYYRDSESSPYRFLQNCNALEDVTIVGSTLPSASEIPWKNVKRLLLRTHTSEKLDIGALFPSLSNLGELVWRNRTELEEILSPITLPRLHTLTLQHLSVFHTHIHMIRVPCLSKLIIDESWTYRDPAPLLTMIHLSGCCITQLELNWESSEAAVNLLSELSRIQNLTLTFVEIETTFDILSSLIWDSEEYLLPYLQTLRIMVKPHYSEEVKQSVANEVSLGLRLIISSRSTFPERQNLLRVVECTWYIPREVLNTYKSMRDDLMEFGKKSGTPVKVEIIARELPTVLWSS